MHRLVIFPQAVQGTSITITDSRQLRHLLAVLRLSVGDQVECLDGAGQRYLSTVVRCTRRQVELNVLQRSQEPPERMPLTLAQALIRPARFEWVVQKATELGVARVIPLLAQRSVARIGAGPQEQKLARWRRIAHEAAAQCGRAVLPKIETPMAMPAILAEQGASRILLPTLACEAEPLRDVLTRWHKPAPVTIMIGPEGDFTTDEVALARRHGARPVSLGRLTLRAETAAIATLSVLRYLSNTL